MRIFYSWQSDLPNSSNRGFIESALRAAAKSINQDPDIYVNPVIDRDIANMPGTVNIADTILAKIEKADVIVSDVSIIGKVGDRAIPNPNVVFELGYAFQCLGSGRTIMVMNDHFGGPELLPFDLRMKSVLKYACDPNSSTKAESRKSLQASLEQALRTIISHAPARQIQAGLTTHDEKLFTKFRTTLPFQGSVSFARDFNMAGFSFSWERLGELDTFVSDWNDVEHQFLNPDLEDLRSKLLRASEEYLQCLSTNSFPTSSDSGYSSVPQEWEMDQPTKFLNVVNTLHSKGAQIAALHQELMKKGIILSSTKSESQSH